MSYPFLFVNHGPAALDALDEAATLWLCFVQEPDEEQLLRLVDSCPPPLAGLFRHAGNLVYAESFGALYPFMIEGEYGGDADTELTAGALTAFSAALEEWLVALHADSPLAFVIGPNVPAEPSEWHHHSVAALPSALVEQLERLRAEHVDLPPVAALDSDAAPPRSVPPDDPQRLADEAELAEHGIENAGLDDDEDESRELEPMPLDRETLRGLIARLDPAPAELAGRVASLREWLA